ncbi:hypothetical protein JOD49_003061 [Oerskovia jenensis]|uniref:Nucleotidyltransferase n=1 Tax=Oerskovia jenensis TaxID=162169 RepID=A0ABS2LI84_9CELL|nr:hypothetical protein [Oerskovia jenensis]
METALRDKLSVRNVWETGSFRHGTGIHNHSDVDVIVSLGATKPLSSDTALKWVKDALVYRFPTTPIRVSRPAVVVNFAGGLERWEVIPGFYRGQEQSWNVFDIPAPGGGWMETAPSAHLKYVTQQNEDPKGGAKSLARLLKVWKYSNNVPVSSFYLEMRAARYMRDEPFFEASQDFATMMERLAASGLAAMNDPMGISGRIGATSTEAYRSTALATLRGDAIRARSALELEKIGKASDAFYKLNEIFPGRFPSRFY